MNYTQNTKFYRDHSEQFWVGAIFGLFVMLLIVLVYDKLTDQPGPSQLTMPKDVVEAYNMGLKDAMKTNPPSLELEQTCVNMWTNKQPVRD